jgi:excisionase family DNA binding protein
MTNNLLTLKETSVKLKISQKTLYDWVYSNKIPYIRLFHEIRFKESEIDNICEKGLQNKLSGDKICILWNCKKTEREKGLWEK